VACGSIFVLLVAVKLLLPGRMAQVNAKLTGMLEQNIDVQAVFSAVGRAVSGEADVDVALQDMYQAVFDPQEDSAVEVSAPAGGEAVSLQLPAAIAPLRAFRTGTGSSDGWNPSAIFCRPTTEMVIGRCRTSVSCRVPVTTTSPIG